MASNCEFKKELQRHFDNLTANMQRPGYAEAVESALFSDPDKLKQHYRPGFIESTAHTPGSRKI